MSRRTSRGGALVLVFAATLPVLAAQRSAPRYADRSSDGSALLRAAQEALDKRDFAAAAKSLQSVVAVEPRSAAAWFNLAYAYSELHENEKAVQAYEKTLELQPDLFEAHLNLAILLIESKRASGAVEHLARAVSLKPDHARAHLYYGRALNLAGQPEQAEKEFQEVLRLDPSLAMGSYDLGQLRLAAKRYEEARAAFEKAAQLDPKLATAELGQALALEGLKQPAEAVGHFERYLASKPEDFETRFHLARLYLDQGKNERALEHLEAVYAAKPQTPGVAAALGDVNALLKRFPDSEKFYRQALLATPGEAELHRVLGQTLLDEEKFAEAEAEFRAALKLDSHSRDAAEGVAKSLYLQKRYTEAIPLLEALAHAPEPAAVVVFMLATSYDDVRDRLHALEAYERFIELSRGRNPDQEWQARQRAKLLRRALHK